MTVVPLWIHLIALPCEYWEMQILKDIGNTIGEFVKVAEQTKQQWYIYFSRICVYMDISKDLLEAISLN